MRTYSASFNGVSVSALQDLFELVAGSGNIIELIGVTVSQSGRKGDAQEEMLKIIISRYTGTSGSGGSTPTIRKHDDGDGASGATVEANNTTQATTTEELLIMDWNIRQPFEYWEPVRENRIVLGPSGGLVVEMPAAPSVTLTMSGTIVWAEAG